MGEHKYDYALSGKKLFAFALPKQLEFLQKKKIQIVINMNIWNYELLDQASINSKYLLQILLYLENITDATRKEKICFTNKTNQDRNYSK